MINIKIYCNKKHQEYQSAYETIYNVMIKNDQDFIITRISEPKAISLQRIKYEPHIVVNNQVIYTKNDSSERDVTTMLNQLRIISGIA